MSEDIQIHAMVSMNMASETEGASGEILISGPSDQLFIAAATAIIKEKLNPGFTANIAGFEWVDPDLKELWVHLIPDGLTLGQAADFFGSEIDSQPPTIYISDAGFGGANVLDYVIEIVPVAGVLYSGVKATLVAQRLALRLRNSGRRALIKEWNDSGLIPAALADDVLNGGNWSRGEFNRTFELGKVRGPELLRALGYERRDYDGFEMWERDADRDV